MSRRIRFVVPILILAFGLVAVGVMVALRPTVEARPPEPVVPLVQVVEVHPSDVAVHVRTQGSGVPRAERDLVPQVSGEVVWISPKLVSGGFFEKGDVLVRIDPGDYEVERRSASALVARARSEFERAGTDLERQRRLKERGVTSQARIDDAQNDYTVAEASWREGQARLARAQRDLERTELTAPFRGRVRTKAVDVGQFVSRGAPVGVIYAVDFAEVRLPLPDRELRWLDLPLGYTDRDGSEGPKVTLRAEFAGSPREWQGRIVRTEGEIDARSRMVHVVARVADPYGHDAAPEAHVPLAVGLFVEAEITGRTLPDAFRLPRAALQSSASSGDVVHVVDAESRLHVRPVEVLRTEREQVVIGAGLSAGERVSISPLPAVVDGMAVRIPLTPAPTPVATPASEDGNAS